MRTPKYKGLLVVVSAPSGGGKTTVCGHLLEREPNAVRAITCTTRAAREGEKDAVDYFFLDPADFLRRLQSGNFLEHATVYGNSYGILKSEVLGKLRQSKEVLLSVDVQGAATIHHRAQDDPELKHALVTVFLLPPSLTALEERLRRRGKDSPSEIQKRLAASRQEIAQWKHFDYSIISDTIEEDVRRMQVILEAERLRTSRVQIPAYEKPTTPL